MQTSPLFVSVRHSGSFRERERRLVRRTHRVSGFTMMELLVVLGILALLAGLAITNVAGIFGGAQDSTAKLFVRESVKAPLFTYSLRMGGYPTTAEGLQALITPPADKADRWGTTPYLEPAKIPMDPWGEPYQYASPGTHNKTTYDIWSKGPDKISGNEDDIGNWDPPTAGAPK